MNYEQANSVKESAEPVNKVLKRLEWKCSGCKGDGRAWGIDSYRNRYTNPCYACNGTGKIKYSWTPQIGEFFKTPDNEIRCIGNELDLENMIVTKDLNDKYIPILEWETIEEILEKAGYYFEEPIKRVYGSEGSKCHCVIKKKGFPKPVGIAWSDSRIKAVYRAVIELGKELE